MTVTLKSRKYISEIPRKESIIKLCFRLQLYRKIKLLHVNIARILHNFQEHLFQTSSKWVIPTVGNKRAAITVSITYLQFQYFRILFAV